MVLECRFFRFRSLKKQFRHPGFPTRTVLALSNAPLGYADLILNGELEEYLKNVAGSHGLED